MCATSECPRPAAFYVGHGAPTLRPAGIAKFRPIVSGTPGGTSGKTDGPRAQPLTPIPKYGLAATELRFEWLRGNGPARAGQRRGREAQGVMHKAAESVARHDPNDPIAVIGDFRAAVVVLQDPPALDMAYH